MTQIDKESTACQPRQKSSRLSELGRYVTSPSFIVVGNNTHGHNQNVECHTLEGKLQEVLDSFLMKKETM